MTVITKSLGDKKNDNLEQPLVENIVVEHPKEEKKCDIEGGGYPIPPPHTTRYIISARVGPYYSLMFILMLVLLVATSLLGIFGTEYLYEQYKYFVGSEQKPEEYRAWGTLSLDDDPSALPYESKVPAHFQYSSEPVDNTNSILSFLFRKTDYDSETELSSLIGTKNEMKEEFEVNLQKGVEKINLPAKQSSRFVHDFYSNYTAIVDTGNKRCFVMPLDRNAVVPPKSLYDLIIKMSGGYYSIDTEKIRHDMEVGDRFTNIESLGKFILNDCSNFPIYSLEKKKNFVDGVVKRSAQESGVFVYFNGKNIMEINVDNLPSSSPRAIP